MREPRRMERELAEIWRQAALTQLAQFRDVGLSDPADLARRLNRRGFPCHGQRRWTSGLVIRLMRRIEDPDLSPK